MPFDKCFCPFSPSPQGWVFLIETTRKESHLGGHNDIAKNYTIPPEHPAFNPYTVTPADIFLPHLHDAVRFQAFPISTRFHRGRSAVAHAVHMTIHRAYALWCVFCVRHKRISLYRLSDQRIPIGKVKW